MDSRILRKKNSQLANQLYAKLLDNPILKNDYEKMENEQK
jgi:hypothetical protein